MERRIYKVETGESGNISILTDRLNRAIDNWRHWDTDLKFDVNRETGNYYFVLTIFQDK